MKIKTNKVALYCRVSTNKQTNANQKPKLMKYVKDYKLNYILFEEQESTRKSRPIKQRLMKRVFKGEFDAVIVYAIDRFARSFSELITDVQEIVSRGIRFISLSEQFDLTTSSGMLQFRIMAAFANFERDIISERTKDGVARARASGTTLGRPIGKKDSKPRATEGYFKREATKRQILNAK